ncbi:MAG: hypothetical protein QW534_09590 [Candidatus Methanomethylicia archaeon]
MAGRNGFFIHGSCSMIMIEILGRKNISRRMMIIPILMGMPPGWGFKVRI